MHISELRTNQTLINHTIKEYEFKWGPLGPIGKYWLLHNLILKLVQYPLTIIVSYLSSQGFSCQIISESFHIEYRSIDIPNMWMLCFLDIYIIYRQERSLQYNISCLKKNSWLKSFNVYFFRIHKILLIEIWHFRRI